MSDDSMVGVDVSNMDRAVSIFSDIHAEMEKALGEDSDVVTVVAAILTAAIVVAGNVASLENTIGLRE